MKEETLITVAGKGSTVDVLRETLSLNKESEVISSWASFHIHIRKHFWDRHIPEHAQYSSAFLFSLRSWYKKERHRFTFACD